MSGFPFDLVYCEECEEEKPVHDPEEGCVACKLREKREERDDHERVRRGRERRWTSDQIEADPDGYAHRNVW